MNYFLKMGIPEVIQIDRGTNITSILFKRVTRQLGVRHMTTSPYHPQSQGTLERFHATLKSMVRAHCTERQTDWDKELPFALFAIRDSIQESLGYTPFELVYGREMRNPLKMAKEKWDNSEKISGYVENLRKSLEKTRKIASEHLNKSQKTMKQNFDKRSKERQLNVGDRVMVLSPKTKFPFDAKFRGPYVITEKIDNLNYKVKTPNQRNKTQLCHINRIKKYAERTDEIGLSVGQVKAIANEDKLIDDSMLIKDTPVKLCNSEILASLEKTRPLIGERTRRIIQYYAAISRNIFRYPQEDGCDLS